jgi:hypothetical protein
MSAVGLLAWRHALTILAAGVLPMLQASAQDAAGKPEYRPNASLSTVARYYVTVTSGPVEPRGASEVRPAIQRMHDRLLMKLDARSNGLTIAHKHPAEV